MTDTNEPRVDAGLEEILGGATPPDLTAAIQRRVAASDRVDITVASSRHGWRRSLGAAALVLFAATIVVATGVLERASRPGVRIRCVGADGQPVAGALVHLYQRLPDPDEVGRYRQFGPYRSDADGRVQCPTALTFGGERFDRFVHAYVPGELVGCARALSRGDAEPDEIEVALTRSRTVRGRITFASNARTKLVRVRVWSFHGPGGMATSLPRNPSFRGLDDALTELYETRTDGDGGFALGDLPADGRLFLVADGDGLAQAQWSNIGIPPGPIPDLVEMEMQLAAVVRGVVVRQEGTPVAGAQVRLRVREGDAPMFIHDWKEVLSDAAGRFQFGALPSGQVEVLAKTDRLAMQPKLLFVDGGRLTDVTLGITPAVALHGTVVDARTGEPVRGARVTAITPDHTPLGGMKSDSEGRFRFLVPTGAVDVYFSALPKGYAYPDPQIVERLELDGSPAGALVLRVHPKR